MQLNLINQKRLSALKTKFYLFLARNFALSKLSIIVFPAYCLDMYLNDFRPTSATTFVAFFHLSCIWLQKFKRYEFKARKANCIKFFQTLKKEYAPQYDADAEMHLKEIFDDNEGFLYTEIFVSLKSNFRIPIEKFKLNDRANFPAHLIND